MLKSIKSRVLVSFLVLMVPVLAFAQAVGVDTTAVVAELSAVQTAIIAVGGVLLTLAAIALGYRWIKGQLFN